MRPDCVVLTLPTGRMFLFFFGLDLQYLLQSEGQMCVEGRRSGLSSDDIIDSLE